MNVNVWMPSGQPIKRQMKKRPLQHKTRTLSNPITFAWDQGDVVGENDNWKSKITCNKYTVLYSVQKLHIVGRKIITNTGVKCSSILLKTTTTATIACVADAERGGGGEREKGKREGSSPSPQSPSPFSLPPYPLPPTPLDACYAGYSNKDMCKVWERQGHSIPPNLQQPSQIIVLVPQTK